MSGEAVGLVVTLQGRLLGFAVGLPVVALVQPGGQGVVEPVQGENLAGADLAFELALGGQEEAFDQSARRRIAHAAMEQADVQGEAGGLQGVGMVNLGVVQVQFAAGPVGTQARSRESMRMSRFSRR